MVSFVYYKPIEKNRPNQETRSACQVIRKATLVACSTAVCIKYTRQLFPKYLLGFQAGLIYSTTLSIFARFPRKSHATPQNETIKTSEKKTKSVSKKSNAREASTGTHGLALDAMDGCLFNFVFTIQSTRKLKATKTKTTSSFANFTLL